jgi:ATP-binding cassette subfamily E protein 1
MSRIAVVKKSKCNPQSCGGHLCKKLCPMNRTGSDCITVDEKNFPKIDEELCNGCGICQNRCPMEAIKIINLPQALNKDPIHRFGQNGFALYNLPTPVFGKVVGLIGRNGIGKSTALQILAGLLKPNFGRETTIEDEKEFRKEIVKYFKGTEGQSYFEKLHNNEIKVAFKPQQVELIPKSFNGTVKELLSKVDQIGKLDEYIKKLDLEKVADSKITEISGGELQRTAIAACALKKANVYFFDEPTSYLDIKQRIKVAKFIQEIAEQGNAVLVIEHDLIILDYLTDLIHILFGRPAAYGIVSMKKASKNGINTYLDGFLREENMRFRDNAIKFYAKESKKDTSAHQITEWEAFEKELGKFKLTANKGIINMHESIGILGENGTGKTTFVKELANTDKLSLNISYKSQKIEVDDELVMTYLAEAKEKYPSLLIDQLQIKDLMMRERSKLSGGELQRVEIAKCLARDCDLYLMDEPSAYLDVEQRLAISKVVNEILHITGRCALIVDHDLLFIDYLSDRLIIFEGEPARHGIATGPFSMKNGMNKFLEELNMTFRRDEETKRPRANKVGSQMDSKQKSEGNWYY